VSELSGKTAMVTGAASGIGAATARALAEAGAKVAVADVNAAGAEEVAASLRQAGAEAIGVGVDISDEEQVAAAVERTARELGGLDVLHNNAAALSPDHMMRDGAIHELDLAFWERTMAVNLSGYFLCTKHALPHMLERGAGVIVNTASTAGLDGDGVRGVYGTSKAGVIGFTRQVATQYGKRGIRCVAIAPGLILSPTAAAIPAALLENMLRHHLTPRLGRPEDIAAMVVFLASDRAGFITGSLIPIDGGLTAHAATWADEMDVLAELGGEP
jgi:NAD(P)-dependent dehydrogenase (short-subunit alcohol dehydrogenase family)